MKFIKQHLLLLAIFLIFQSCVIASSPLTSIQKYKCDIVEAVYQKKKDASSNDLDFKDNEIEDLFENFISQLPTKRGKMKFEDNKCKFVSRDTSSLKCLDYDVKAEIDLTEEQVLSLFQFMGNASVDTFKVWELPKAAALSFVVGMGVSGAILGIYSHFFSSSDSDDEE